MRLTIMFLLCTIVTIAVAQPARWPTAPKVLSMVAVADLKQSTLEVQVGNGQVEDTRNWPASFVTKASVGENQEACTSTLVGPNSLLTAAHCIADLGQVTIEMRGHSYTGTCERPHPGYPTYPSADWALCLMLAIPAHQSETIDLSISQLSRNSQLLLTGFGCTAIAGKSDGKFRSGPTFVDQLPGQIADYPDWLATVAAVESGDAFICPGDSGGAAFQLLPGIGRVLVAVNSNYDTAGKGISYLSVLGTPDGISFLNQWRCKHKQLLNGIDQNAMGCRE